MASLTQVLLGLAGLVVVVFGAVGRGAPASPLIALGGVMIVAALLWRAGAAAGGDGFMDRTMPLGDRTTAEGQVAVQPRRRVVIAAAFFAVLGTGAAAGTVAAALTGSAAGAVVLGVITAVLLPYGLWGLSRVNMEQWVGFSRAGITVHGTVGHFTIPWTTVDRVGTWHLWGQPFFAIAADIDQVVGTVSPVARRTARGSGWSIVLPGRMFDVSVDELIDGAERWRRVADGLTSPAAERVAGDESAGNNVVP